MSGQVLDCLFSGKDVAGVNLMDSIKAKQEDEAVFKGLELDIFGSEGKATLPGNT